MSAEQKDLGDSAMGDGEKACPCCQFYGVPCRQARATEDEATIRRKACSPVQRERGLIKSSWQRIPFSLTVHWLMSYRPSRRERILSALEIHRSRTKHSMIMLMG